MLEAAEFALEKVAERSCRCLVSAMCDFYLAALKSLFFHIFCESGNSFFTAAAFFEGLERAFVACLSDHAYAEDGGHLRHKRAYSAVVGKVLEGLKLNLTCT